MYKRQAEAIEDFGDFNEFVREVLSAYHVKAPFDQADAIEAAVDVQPTAGDRLDEAVRAGSGAFGRAAAATKNGARKIGETMSSAFGKATDRVRSGVQNAKGAGDAAAAAVPFAGGQRGDILADAEGTRRAPGAFRRLIAAAWNVCVRVVKTCVRWVWNFAVACCTAFCLFAGLASLFLFGVCAVLLAQGYPMLGATVAGVGATMLFGAGAFLLSRLIVRKRAGDKRVGRDASHGDAAAPHGPAPVDCDEAPLRVAGAQASPVASGSLEETRPLEFSLTEHRYATAYRAGASAASASSFATAPLHSSRFDTMPLGIGAKGGVCHD